MDVALVSSGEERAMPTTFTQRCARHLPFRRAISMTAESACCAAIARMVPVCVEDGDIITPRIVYRAVPTGALPVRITITTSPARAFDRSAAPVAPRLPDAEHCGPYASLNHPSPEGRGAIPSEVGAPLCRVRVWQPERRRQARPGPAAVSCGERGVAPSQRPFWADNAVSRQPHHRRPPPFFVLRPPAGTFFLRWRSERGATCVAPRWSACRRPGGYETG